MIKILIKQLIKDTKRIRINKGYFNEELNIRIVEKYALAYIMEYGPLIQIP